MNSAKMVLIHLFAGRDRDTDIENRLADTVGEGGGTDRAVSSHRPSCANQTARDKPLHSTGSSARCSLRTTRVGWNRVEGRLGTGKRYVCICVADSC